jgi:hypothetical protein
MKYKKLITIIITVCFANALCGQITSSRGDSFCEGNATVLTLTGGTGNYVWTYQYGTGAADTIQNQNGGSVTVTPHFFGTVTYRVYAAGSTTPLSTKFITVKDCCDNGATADFRISKVCTPMTIDGEDNELEWSVSPWVDVNKLSFGTFINSILGNNTSAGKWRMLYDDQNIYLYIRVYDDQQPYNSYWNTQNVQDGFNGDGIEIYVNAGDTCGGYPLQIGLIYPTTGTTPDHYNNYNCQGISFAGYSAVVNRWTSENKFWSMEVKFPAALNNVNLNGDNISVEVAITQSNSTSGTSQRGSLMHTWTVDKDMFQHIGSLSPVPLADCASTRANLEVVCENAEIQLNTSIKSATTGVDAATAYTWQKCYSGCDDNTVGSTNWTNAAANTAGDVTLTPDFNGGTSVYYRAVYNGEIAACPIKILSADNIGIPRTATICAGETYNFYGQMLTTPDIYEATVPSQTGGCDSIIRLELTVLPKDTENREHSICLGESYNFYGQILTQSGNYTASVPSQTGGCDSTINLNFIVLSIENDVDGECCSAGLIEQNWNDVIAVLNERYNGGLHFTAFQWYKSGSPIPGETKSYIYLPEGLDMTAQYSVLLTLDDNRQISSCTLRPIYNTDINTVPQIIQSSGILRMQSPQACTLKIYNITGILIGTQQFGAETTDITIPLKSGMYILQATMADDTVKIFKITI